MIRSADLLFLPMHALPRGVRAGLVPTKTYEYAASGRPILAAVPEGDARDFLVELGTAAVVDPDDTPGMEKIIEAEIERWRRSKPPSRTRFRPARVLRVSGDRHPGVRGA